MKGDPIKSKVLSLQIIPNADTSLKKALNVRCDHNSLGIFTCDCDDVSYAALDEATKKADVCVAYARSMYGGSSNASTKLAGEFLGILSGPDPESVISGLKAASDYVHNDAFFYSANEDDSIVYFAHCISRTGSYLSQIAGAAPGTAMAYVIAAPAEAIVGLDAALKAADVKMNVFYGPPTETNFGGGLLTGDQDACRAACEAFADAVCRVAAKPCQC